MTIWVDAQLPPAIARWVASEFGVEARAVRDLGLREAEDVEIFDAARDADAVLMTKDADFVELLRRRGGPPAVIWLTCGNTSNARLREILAGTLGDAMELVGGGESLVEIREPRRGRGDV
jgi:predicted nuclease of predicted toxin-antitoxin system